MRIPPSSSAVSWGARIFPTPKYVRDELRLSSRRCLSYLRLVLLAGREGLQLPAVRDAVHVPQRPHQAHQAEPLPQEDRHRRGRDHHQEEVEGGGGDGGTSILLFGCRRGGEERHSLFRCDEGRRVLQNQNFGNLDMQREDWIDETERLWGAQCLDKMLKF